MGVKNKTSEKEFLATEKSHGEKRYIVHHILATSKIIAAKANKALEEKQREKNDLLSDRARTLSSCNKQRERN